MALKPLKFCSFLFDRILNKKQKLLIDSDNKIENFIKELNKPDFNLFLSKIYFDKKGNMYAYKSELLKLNIDRSVITAMSKEIEIINGKEKRRKENYKKILETFFSVKTGKRKK